jgi:molybdenum-dependent DNA-binding transcriptional regulator ModE
MGTSEQGLQMRYRKITRMDNKEVVLDTDMIRLLIAIEENKALEQIAREIGMDTDTLSATLAKLLKLKLVEPVRKNGGKVRSQFLEALKLHLSRAVGPMAQILLEDAMSDMNLSGNGIPQNQAAELISVLAVDIPDEDVRIQFKKAMLPLIRA